MFIINSYVYSSGGGGTPPGAHRYWRIYISANDGHASLCGLTELVLYDTSGNQISGEPLWSTVGANASSEINVSNVAEQAFDDVFNTGWLAATAANEWISWDMQAMFAIGSPQEVKDFDIYGSWNAPTASPKDFELQWSDDNVAWTAAKVVTGETGWTAAELRSFNVF
jgi:hypothetical protein